MTFWQILILGVILVGAGAAAWFLSQRQTSSAPCVGCGMCHATGVCVMTGERVSPQKARREKKRES